MSINRIKLRLTVYLIVRKEIEALSTHDQNISELLSHARLSSREACGVIPAPKSYVIGSAMTIDGAEVIEPKSVSHEMSTEQRGTIEIKEDCIAILVVEKLSE